MSASFRSVGVMDKCNLEYTKCRRWLLLFVLKMEKWRSIEQKQGLMGSNEGTGHLRSFLWEYLSFSHSLILSISLLFYFPAWWNKGEKIVLHWVLSKCFRAPWELGSPTENKNSAFTVIHGGNLGGVRKPNWLGWKTGSKIRMMMFSCDNIHIF